MDAFYASVEMRDHPEWRNLPLVVGGNPNSRAVVCAASYKAREYGVRSAMACSVARRLCPDALFVPPNFPRYREVSEHIHQIFHQYTDRVEALSLDEAWLDVTENHLANPSATLIAQEIKAQVKRETGLTCSAGVSYNKFLAKIASDEKKPDGLFVITPKFAPEFLKTLQVKKIPGVGKVTAQKLESLGIQVGGDLLPCSEEFLKEHLGKFGQDLYLKARGIDHRPVVTSRETKSVSVETTFETDLKHGQELERELAKLVESLFNRLQQKALTGKTLNLKVKFADFQQVTRSVSSQDGYSDPREVLDRAAQKLRQVCQKEHPFQRVRLIGIGLSRLELANGQRKSAIQLDFFHLIDHSQTLPSQVLAQLERPSG